MRDRKKKLIVGAAAMALAAGLAGGGAAIASGRATDDDGPSVTGPEADRATGAALEATGGGRANAVERDSEDGAVWEVEVTKAGGATVDVRLDASYGVVVIEGDSETENEIGTDGAKG